MNKDPKFAPMPAVLTPAKELPSTNKFGRGLMAAAAISEVKSGAIVADKLRDAVAEELRREDVLKRATALIRSPEFQRAIDEIVREHAKSIVVEVLAERDGELDAAVRRIVSERWDEAVRRAAHEVLDARLDEVKRRLG
jgi:hypothetical protein